MNAEPLPRIMSSSSDSDSDWTDTDLPGPDLSGVLQKEIPIKPLCNEDVRSQINSDMELAVFLQNQEAELQELSSLSVSIVAHDENRRRSMISVDDYEDEDIPIPTFSLGDLESSDDSNDENVLETIDDDILEALELTLEQREQLLALMRNDSVNYSVPGLKVSQIRRLQRPCVVVADCDDNCGICITEFAAGDRKRVLKCKHFFHVDCIDQWLQKTALCPLCRNQVIPPRRLRLSRCTIL
ncbi:RING-H2 finger protein ATL3-like [Gigantopelta aegis]|uniref:RING-H2 finger protein ATL3-like n=1 Tax=Gigantopelta aegis TaxID=1735272 RepID=UPI001B88AF9C|nr:RING-H2 finger protein ATL3-like [Gigantopelta aegis]XP_041369032.1 RING-H2 finger protein ATL3-like [Gigantopelta aegis]